MQAPAVVLLMGPEAWLKDQAIRRLKEENVARGFEEVDWVRFPEPPAELAELFEAASIYPLGSARRLVVVEGLDLLSPELQARLAQYLKRPNPKSCLALCLKRWEQDWNLLFPEHRRDGSLQIVLCRALKGPELKGWVKEQASRLGKSIDPEAVDLLITRLGNELVLLANALESLSLLAAQFPRITAAEVEALMAPSVRETAFDILDQAAAGRPGLAVALLRQALGQGRLAVEQMMGALGWYYRMVWRSRTGFSMGSWTSVSRQAAMGRLKEWPLARLQQALEDLLKADADLKLGHPAPEWLADRELLRLGS